MKVKERKDYVIRALFGREGLYQLKGKYDEAIEDNKYILRITTEKRAVSSAYARISHALERKGKLKEALEYVEKAVEKAEGMPYEEARILNWKANVLLRLGKYESARKVIKGVLEILKTLENEEISSSRDILIEESIAYNTLASIYYGTRRLKKAAEYYEKGYEIRERLKDPAGISMMLNNLGVVYTELEEYERALDCLKRSLEIRKKLEHFHGIGSVWINLAFVYDRMGEYGKALAACRRSLKYLGELGDLYGTAIVHMEMGSIFEIQGKNKKAERHYLEALTLRETIHDFHGAFDVILKLGDVALKKGEYKKVKRWIEKGRKTLEEMEWKEGEIDLLILEGRWMISSGMGEGIKKIKGALKMMREKEESPEDVLRLAKIINALLEADESFPQVEKYILFLEERLRKIKNIGVKCAVLQVLSRFYEKRDRKKSMGYKKEMEEISKEKGIIHPLTG
ncbi:hypothetical protein DRQ20_01570 [bacterium]|nr:MAG: hypothetical protein DRQ20_01570 [bacterium]